MPRFRGRSVAAASGRRATVSAAASTGSTATARASGSVCAQPNWMSTGGTGVVADEVSVIAGTSSSASTTPSTRPATADGRLSMSFSRHSWPAAARGGTPSAASSAFSARRWRTPAAMLTQKPVMASTAAAMATTSSACCGTVDSGSLSNPVATPAADVMSDPGGRSAASPAGPAGRPAGPARGRQPPLARLGGGQRAAGQDVLQTAEVHDQGAAAERHGGERRHLADDFDAEDRAVDVGLHHGSDAGVTRGQEALGRDAGQRGHRGGPGQGQLPADRAGRHARRHRWAPARSRGRASPTARCRMRPWP